MRTLAGIGLGVALTLAYLSHGGTPVAPAAAEKITAGEWAAATPSPRACESMRSMIIPPEALAKQAAEVRHQKQRVDDLVRVAIATRQIDDIFAVKLVGSVHAKESARLALYEERNRTITIWCPEPVASKGSGDRT